MKNLSRLYFYLKWGKKARRIKESRRTQTRGNNEQLRIHRPILVIPRVLLTPRRISRIFISGEKLGERRRTICRIRALIRQETGNKRHWTWAERRHVKKGFKWRARWNCQRWKRYCWSFPCFPHFQFSSSSSQEIKKKVELLFLLSLSFWCVYILVEYMMGAPLVTPHSSIQWRYFIRREIMIWSLSLTSFRTRMLYVYLMLFNIKYFKWYNYFWIIDALYNI